MKRHLALFAVLVFTLAISAHAEQDAITLKDGDTLNAEIINRGDSTTTINHPDLGTVTLDNSKIDTVLTAEEQAAADAAAALEEASKFKLIPGWDSSLNIALNGSDGNSRTLGLSILFDAARESDTSKTKVDAAYFYAKDDGGTSKNEATVGAVHDWIFEGSKWFTFIEGRFDFDQFESFDTRFSAAGGVGYHLIERDNFFLDLRAGGGVTQEFGSDEDDPQPNALIGADLGWDIADNQKLTAGTRLFLDVGDIEQVRTRSHVDYVFLVDEKQGIQLKLGIVHEYESEPDPGILRSDTTYYASLGVNF
ncbi:MAG: DUF481 domain-containing protein [Planctomycetota bacterium]